MGVPAFIKDFAGNSGTGHRLTFSFRSGCQVDVTMAGLDGIKPVTCSRQVVLVPDISFDDAVSEKKYDVIICPGGMKGAQSIAAVSAEVTVVLYCKVHAKESPIQFKAPRLFRLWKYL